jgi:uncharacterized protein (DUF58 family)
MPTEVAANTGIYTELRTLLGLRFSARKLNLFNRRLASSQLFGETRSHFRGRGMDFEEVRLYQPGDDIRAIDWRVTARTGKPHTKVFREERERPVHLMVDQRSAMFFGSGTRFKSVLAAELAALIGWAALGNSDRIGGQVLGDSSEVEVRARRNRHAVLQLLHHLDEFNHALPGDAEVSLSLADALESYRHLSRPGTALFIISDFHDLDTRVEKYLRLLGRHVDISLIQIIDPFEDQLPALGRVTLSDGHHRQQLAIDARLATHFREQTQARHEQLRHIARLIRAQLITASTADDPLATLQAIYGTV